MIIHSHANPPSRRGVEWLPHGDEARTDGRFTDEIATVNPQSEPRCAFQRGWLMPPKATDRACSMASFRAIAASIRSCSISAIVHFLPFGIRSEHSGVTGSQPIRHVQVGRAGCGGNRLGFAVHSSCSLSERTSASTSARRVPMASGSSCSTSKGGSGRRCLNSIRQRAESSRLEPYPTAWASGRCR